MKANSVSLKAVPIITFFIGFFSFVTLSIYYQVFWINSKYDVPLIYNVSVMIGDSILLPIINYNIFNLCFNYLGINELKQSFYSWIVFVFFLSIALNVFTHLSWINDSFSDFVGFSQGNLSFIGYWHLIFSIFQMIILMTFPYLWYISIRNQNVEAIEYSKKIWQWFFLFTLLSFFDMLNKYLFVYHDTFVSTMKSEGFPFSTSIMAVILYIIMKLIQKNIERRVGLKL